VSHTLARKFWFDFALALCGLLLALAAYAGGAGRGGDMRGVTPEPRAAARALKREVKTEPYAGKVAYVIVALCDNVNQGIVPVPAALGFATGW
jgi:hypothetical protein